LAAAADNQENKIMLPLLLLAGASLAAREGNYAGIRQDFGDSFRAGLGERAQLVGPGVDESGQELAGPPQQKGGRGLLGTISDPVQQAYLEMLGGLAGKRGVSPELLMASVRQVTGEAAQGKQQERQFGQQFEMQARDQSYGIGQQQRAQDFQAVMQSNDQDFRAWEADLNRRQQEAMQRNQFGQAWAMEKYREGMANARANMQSRLGAGQTFYAGPPVGPGGQPVPIVGPQSGTEQYVKGVESVRGARNAVQNADDLLTSYHTGGRGREFSGEEAGRQSAMYQKLVTDMAKAYELGTIQKSDLEYIQSFQRAPNEFWSKAYAQDPTMIGALDRTRDAFAKTYAMRREANPWTVGLSGDIGTDLPEKPTKESVAARLSGRADAETRARLEAVTAPGQRAAGKIRKAGE
jgi:hypothetical protein